MIRPLVVLGVLLLALGCDDSTTPASPRPMPEPDPAPAPDPGPGPVPPEIAAWIDANAHPFVGTDPSLPHGDIEFLREMVGDARIVALGENTHGTRDFFEMKFRILRFLVEEMGFNTFAMESSWPEARLADRYVRAGEGDSAQALSALVFLVWRTETVLAMLEWMREHNERGGDLAFHGFDMQFPGLALHNVLEYLGEVDPVHAAEVEALVECLNRYANRIDSFPRWPEERYRDQTDAYRAECGASLEAASELLLANRERYEAVTGEDGFEVALQSLRVAIQFHLFRTGEQDRDMSMAENTEWIAERVGPEGRMVLWAHNYHVSTQPETQGGYLRETFGDDMVVLGFTHARGSFTAWDLQGNQLAHDLDPPVEDSVEHYLSAASAPQFVLDLRAITENTEDGSWLAEPHLTRFIGFYYDPDESGRFWGRDRMTELYDLLAHFETTGPTAIVPFSALVDTESLRPLASGGAGR